MTLLLENATGMDNTAFSSSAAFGSADMLMDVPGAAAVRKSILGVTHEAHSSIMLSIPHFTWLDNELIYWDDFHLGRVFFKGTQRLLPPGLPPEDKGGYSGLFSQDGNYYDCATTYEYRLMERQADGSEKSPHSNLLDLGEVIRLVDVSVRGRKCLCASSGGKCFVTDLNNGSMRLFRKDETAPLFIAWLGQETFCVIGTGRDVTIYGDTSGDTLWKTSHLPERPSKFHHSRDCFALVFPDGWLEHFNSREKKQQTFSMHKGQILALSLSPDGKISIPPTKMATLFLPTWKQGSRSGCSCLLCCRNGQQPEIFCFAPHRKSCAKTCCMCARSMATHSMLKSWISPS